MGRVNTTIGFAGSVLEGGGPKILNEIKSPDCALAIWQRRPSPLFQTWVDGLKYANLPDLCIILPPAHVEEAIDISCGNFGLPMNAGRKLLASDIASLAAIFSQVMQADMLRVRLEAVSGNACTKFHLDNVTARLLCTYRGRGTEYGMFRPGGSPQPIKELPVGSVGLFRGKRWLGPYSGVVHRSPPICSTNKVRLLLVIDMLEET